MNHSTSSTTTAVSGFWRWVAAVLAGLIIASMTFAVGAATKTQGPSEQRVGEIIREQDQWSKDRGRVLALLDGLIESGLQIHAQQTRQGEQIVRLREQIAALQVTVNRRP